MGILTYDDSLAMDRFRSLVTEAEEGSSIEAKDWSWLGAAWRRGSPIGSALAAADHRSGVDFERREEGFTGQTVWDAIKGTKYEAYERHFYNVNNREALNAVMAQIDAEEEDARNIASAGWKGWLAEGAMSLISPTTFLPGGVIAGGLRTGAAVTRSAISVGLASASAIALDEAMLHETQLTRTPEESAVAVGAGAIFGGLLGGGVAAVMSRSQMSAALRAIEAASRPEFEAASEAISREVEQVARQSAGAAATSSDTLDDLSIAGKAASKQAELTAKLNPVLRTLQSPSKTVRSIASQMMENPAYLKKNIEGRGDTAAETAIHVYARGAVVRAMEAQEKAFREARRAGLQMSYPEFRREVGRAMRRGDTSDIPAVEQAAKAWRAHVIEPLKERAIENNMLPPDVQVTTAESYLSRLWNRSVIEANEQEFRSIVRGWLSGTLDEQIAREGRKKDRMLLNLQRHKNDLEAGILRRNEGLRRRLEGGEISTDEFDEDDIVSFVRRVNSGERPKAPESLSQWLKRQRDGIYDPNGELAAIMPEARRVPGLLRNTLKGKFNPKGGLSLDDIVLRAWEEGFLNDAGTVRAGSIRDTAAERPSIGEFLSALDMDLRGERVVRLGDIEAARAADDFDRVMAAMERAGVDFERPKFATSEAMRDIAAKVTRALDEMDRQRIAVLETKIADLDRRGDLDFVSDADREGYIEAIIDDIYAKVTGRNYDGAAPSDLTITTRGPLKERTFNIPDALVEKFLESDVELVGRRYARVMAADIELTERFGSPDLKSALDGVREEYQGLRQSVLADEKLTPAERDKRLRILSKREADDIKDLSDVRDLLRGQFRPEVQGTTWARIANAANTFNFLVAMGGVAIASLTETVRPAMVHGLRSFMVDGLKPLVTNLKAFRLSAEEGKIAGAVTERWLAGRIATLAELTDPYAMGSPFERFMENVASGFAQATGLLHINDAMKSVASVMTQTRILRNARKAAAEGFDSLPAKEKAYMGYLGLGEGRAEQIGKLFDEFGADDGGVLIANSDQWTDDALRRAYRAAINKDVDSIITTKGVGDVPVFAHTPLGRTLLQFKTFAIASNQRVLMRGLQEDKARFIGGLVAMTTIGMMIYAFKQWESGREISANPGTWIAEGLDRTGIFSVAFEINNMFEKIDAPGLYTAASALFPDKDQSQPASRYAVRNAVGGFLGPSFGTANDLLTVGSAGFRALRGSPDLTAGDVGAMRRLTPFASLPYWRWAIDGMLVPEIKESVK